ncbi:MAG: CRISPR system precrRNA processing endoribonuclease RAMP protein Cas6 [Anaerolineae bacterium]|nr:CRISPR system precrRNA processing endoribonuclease RAMP protein Cas6 [Anaerolineae bacterium]
MTAHDLTAMVVKLRPIEPCEIRDHMGRASQEFMLRLLGRHDPALAAALHPAQGSHDLKPFTTSSLLHEGSTTPIYGLIREDEQVWLRLTSLARPVSIGLDALRHNPPTKQDYAEAYQQGLIQIKDAVWRAIPDAVPICAYDHRLWWLDGIDDESVQHPWAGRLNYADLRRQVEQTRRGYRFSLRFESPTTFHSKGLDVPLPIPTLIFRNLIDRWSAFAPSALPPDLFTFVEQFVAVTRYTTKTLILAGKQSKHVGFVGEVTFTIKANNPGLRNHDPDLANTLEGDHKRLSGFIALLTRFAFFSGVGRQTTTGMGMCFVSE